MEITFRNFDKNDWIAISTIYKQGIETGNATFQQEVPTWEEWNNNHLQICRIAAIINDKIVGWCALIPVSSRCVYQGVAEESIYIDENYRGKKIGEKLLQELINQSEKHNFWTLQAGIFPENIASIQLHQKLGFRIVGTREKLGKMNQIWRDVVLLERRSSVTGNS